MWLTWRPSGCGPRVRSGHASRANGTRALTAYALLEAHMAELKLTADSVEKLPYRRSEARWFVHWHHKLKGFGLRVTESDSRAYVVRYRLQGSRSQRLRTLGSVTVLKFGQALERAREVLREAEIGRDWFDEVKRTRAQTLGQVWAYYFREHA